MKLTKILFGLFLISLVSFMGAACTTGNVVKETPIEDTNIEDQNTQTTPQEQTGCQYDNPKCESTQICENNKCITKTISKGKSLGHGGGGGGGGSPSIPPVIIPLGY